MFTLFIIGYPDTLLDIGPSMYVHTFHHWIPPIHYGDIDFFIKCLLAMYIFRCMNQTFFL